MVPTLRKFRKVGRRGTIIVPETFTIRCKTA
nr:MAG TPA: hypothetical protein [Caudoviricetes sp.]